MNQLMRTTLIAAAVLLSGLLANAQVFVKPYVKKDGTYVDGYYRSSPDKSFDNNYSTKPNINPYTGIPGTRVTPPPSYGGESTPRYSPPSYSAPSYGSPNPYGIPKPKSIY